MQLETAPSKASGLYGTVRGSLFSSGGLRFWESGFLGYLGAVTSCFRTDFGTWGRCGLCGVGNL